MSEGLKVRGFIRLFLGLLVGVTAVAVVAPAAGALPSSDPYAEIDPEGSYPLADLVVSVRYEGVTDGTTGSWLGWRAILTVKNIGNKRAGASSVTASSEERNEAGSYARRTLTQPVYALDPGQTRTLESLYFRRPCWVRFAATADSAKVVQESVETNNVTRRDIADRCS